MFSAVSYAESGSEAQIYIFCMSFLYYTCSVFSLRRIYHVWLMFSWICCCMRYIPLSEFASSKEVQVTVYMHNTSFHLWACVHIPEHRRRLNHGAKVCESAPVLNVFRLIQSKHHCRSSHYKWNLKTVESFNGDILLLLQKK